MKIKDFFIECRRCETKSRVNIGWIPNQKLSFMCFTCGHMEIINVSGEAHPETKKEFIESVSN